MTTQNNPEMTMTAQCVIKEYEVDISVSFDELFESNGDIKIEEQFEKAQKKWFASEYKRSVIQAADVLKKTNIALNEEVLIKTAVEIIEHKVSVLENALKQLEKKI